MLKGKVTRKYFSMLFTISLLFSFLSLQTFAQENDTDTEDPPKFTDITLYEDEIYQLVELGIINGYPDGTFRPKEPITRLQAITILIREMNLDTSNRPDPFFLDISPGEYGYEEIATAFDEGMISGKKGYFDPNGKLTRAQFAKIMVKTYDLTLKEGYDRRFIDVPKTHWAYDYVKILASNGITLGYADGTFMPEDQITREHFVLFLSRYINEVSQ